MLIPLDELARPRIDVLVTLSGIFRDLLPLQIKLMAEAAFLAASADEPVERNFVQQSTHVPTRRFMAAISRLPHFECSATPTAHMDPTSTI